MFSLDKFYYILYKNLFESKQINNLYFFPFGSTSWTHLTSHLGAQGEANELCDHIVLHYDQEPLYKHFIDKLLIERFAGVPTGFSPGT